MKRLIIKVVVIGGLMASGVVYAKNLEQSFNDVVANVIALQNYYGGTVDKPGLQARLIEKKKIIDTKKDKIGPNGKVVMKADGTPERVALYSKAQIATAMLDIISEALLFVNQFAKVADSAADLMANLPLKDIPLVGDDLAAVPDRVKTLTKKVGDFSRQADSGTSLMKQLVK